MIYIFRCRKCAKTFEQDLPINAERPSTCECGGTLQRVYTAPAVHYRGSGFFSNDKKLVPVHPLDYDADVHTPEDLKG